MTKNISAELEKAKQEGQNLLLPNNIRINVGMSTDCIAKGAETTYTALEYGLKEKNIDAQIVKVGSNGLSFAAPTVEVQQPGQPKVIYNNVTADKVPTLIEAIATGSAVTELALARVDSEEHVLCGSIKYTTKSATGSFDYIPKASDVDFLARQQKVLLRNAGSINPESIEEYCARGGYDALTKAVGMKPDNIIAEITKAELRGRGGGGFPTGTKWQLCRQAKSDEKYVICNVSEGEPGIGMHRSFLESDPHSVLEGLIIGAYAIGAQTAYVYIRDNYRLALNRFRKAVADAEHYGIVGNNILGSKFSINVKIKEGGGRFVCGEETSLIACIEGRIGEPVQRPPFPVVKGLFGKPTCINNVETFANVPVILLKGSAWYKGIGTKSSKGTKVLSLAGNIERSGMIEVAMGTALKEVIYDIGGGIPNGKALKGIQTGGPSGGLLPASAENLAVDFDELKKAGSMLGSGGMVFMDETTDMVKIARYFTDFFVQESCGKCSPCREGVCRLCAILDTIIAKRGSQDDLQMLKDLSDPITKACACALGKTAPVPILSTLQHFESDYQAYFE